MDILVLVGWGLSGLPYYPVGEFTDEVSCCHWGGVYFALVGGMSQSDIHMNIRTQIVIVMS